MTRRAYAVPEVAELLGGVTERFVWHLIEDGSLPSIKIGRRRLVPAEDLDAYIKGLRDDAQRAREAATARPARGVA